MKKGLFKLKKEYFQKSDLTRLYIVTDFEKYYSYCIKKFATSQTKKSPLDLGWYDVFPGIQEPPPYDYLNFRNTDIFLKLDEKDFNLDLMTKYKMFRVLQNNNIFWGFKFYFQRV